MLRRILIFSLLYCFSAHIFAIESDQFVTYNFDKLSRLLGYPSDNLFGSTEDQINDLETYTTKDDTYYKDINLYLRSNRSNKIQWQSVSPNDSRKIISSIDSIFNKIPPLPSDLILFRGSDLKYRSSISFSPGSEFIEKGYMSTSTSFKIANYFANEMDDNANTPSLKAVFVLYSTKTKLKGILIDQGENEVLLNYNQHIRIMEIDKSNKYDTYLAQICNSKCENQTRPSALAIFKKIIKH